MRYLFVIFFLFTMVVVPYSHAHADKTEHAKSDHKHAHTKDAKGDHKHTHAKGDCTCAEGKKGGTTWCEKCNKGYVNGKKTDKKADITHTKGDHKHEGTCTCAEGKKGGTTWCEKCNKGYVKGKMTKNKADIKPVKTPAK
jgi:hypothetical protein